MSIDNILRRALNGTYLPLASDVAGHYTEKLAGEIGPIAAPKWYACQMSDLVQSLGEVQKAQFDPSQCGFFDARGDSLMLSAEAGFIASRKGLAEQIASHMAALRRAFEKMYDTVLQEGRVVLCQHVDGRLVVAQYNNGDMLGMLSPREKRTLMKIPLVNPICNLEEDEMLYPEQPVALYDSGRLRGCGFAVERKGSVRVYRSLLHGRVATIPIDSGVEVVPLRAEKRSEFDEKFVGCHPYKDPRGYK